MAGLFPGFCSPQQTTVEPKKEITLTLSTQTTSLQSEFRWQESDITGWSGTPTAGTTVNQLVLPPNTMERDKIMAWQGRYRDVDGWSDWGTFFIDTSGWKEFRVAGTATTTGIGPLGDPDLYEARIAVRDGSGAVWGTGITTDFTVHDNRNLVRGIDNKWRGTPVQISRGSGVWDTVSVP